MKHSARLFSIVLVLVSFTAAAFGQRSASSSSGNAALRYWSAFSVVQDFLITPQDAKELNSILDGTTRYDDSKYKDLLQKNALPLEILSRATSLPNCDWGLDYGLGDNVPVEYARKALFLGRINVLYTFHLFSVGDKERGVQTLAAGLRFSHDVANGGSLFATIIAKDLLLSHLRAISDLQGRGALSSAQRARLAKEITTLGSDGVDWSSAMKQEMKLLNKPPWQASTPLERVTQAYVAALNDPKQLPELQQLIAKLPLPLRDVIPGPEQVIQQKQELDTKLAQTRSVLQ